MALFKYTMIFTYQSGINTTGQTPVRIGGWSESYYAIANDAATIASFQMLMQLRLNICPLGTFINRYRIQQVDPANISTLQRVSLAAPPTFLSDIPQVALKVRFFSGNVTGQFVREFRGVPDAMITVGEYTPTAPYNTAVIAFLNGLIGTWYARRRDKTQTQFQITSIDAVGSVVMTVPFVGIANGLRVQVIRTVNPMTGRKFGYFATVGSIIDNQHFQIVGPKVKASGFGTMRLAAITTGPFLNPQLGGIEAVVRKVGRPFRAYSGRASRHQ